MAGFAVGAAALGGCRQAPVEHAIPYLVQPEEVIPGRALFYATTCQACPAACGMLAKTIDGRPIKLEGNRQHPLSRGGLCAVGQASLLGLYDSLRLSKPLKRGRETSWEEADRRLARRLAEIRDRGGRVRFLSSTIPSPALRSVVNRFLEGFRDGRLVEFDALSSSAIVEAHRKSHGLAALPHFDFARASLIAGFDADFLGTWISPVEFASGYRRGRQPENGANGYSFHVQFESRMSVTGANADQRIVVSPDSLAPAMAYLLHLLWRKAGRTLSQGLQGPTDVDEGLLESLAERLWESRGKSLIVCGSQDLESQLLCNALNELLGSYGATIDLEKPSLQKRGSDQAMRGLIRDLNKERVDALFISATNPLHSLPPAGELKTAISKVPLTVAFSERLDETSRLAEWVCPVPHYLESWSDAEPVAGIASLAQPAIQPMGEARQVEESLSAWMGQPRGSLRILKDYWREAIFPRASTDLPFQSFWDRSLHDGFAVLEPRKAPVKPYDEASVPWPTPPSPNSQGLQLIAYPKVAMLDGLHGYNAWLHELPDPISKAAWGNYACLSPATAERMGLEQGDVVRLSAGDGEIELPVVLQPGQHDRVVAVALGYGSEGSKRFSKVGPQWIEARPTVGEDGRVGENVAPLLDFKDGFLRLAGRPVQVAATGASAKLAFSQSYDRLEEPEHLRLANQETRPIIQQTTLAALLAGEPPHHGHHPTEDLWPEDHDYPDHHWGLAIDLEACTGCSACVIACQAENNIPVVGKDEVARNRQMHWLRIDRYYMGSGASPDVAFQPMMCAHCDHAPCETVCPVLATVHSSEGLNQQVYNRCVGTRYCANNCPYKVRRFNWFDYASLDPAADLALNPNVTVRSRGVMEKCSFCVQRIQEAKLESRREGRALQDGDIQPACQQSCPSRAIVFGDMNDPDSRLSRLKKRPRAYRALEELNIRPSVTYLALVRNREEEGGKKEHG